ncbi:hypothetical protein L1049_004898 [Liquidambar formosana]|uniref:Pentatricopeptide repeat-containing protein n=1 Tax=Liquidambar formosana TaxID=63359 RepID=A0AAP0RTE4_LIQFO
MASSLHSTLTFLSPSHSPKLKPPITRSHIPIRCGPRDKRGPLVKGRVLSIEAIQAIQSLKRAHRNDQTNLNHDDLISKSLSRLIKADLIAALKELLRQDRCDLALRVFSVVRSEYKADLSLYADLVSGLGKKRMWDDIDRLICDLEAEEGAIDCDDKALVRLIKALIEAERVESTVRIYGLMKKSGWGDTCKVDEYVVKVLSRGLRRLGEKGVADEVEKGSNLEKLRV